MITGMMTVLLVGCVMLPGSYVFSDYPPERAFILSQAIVTGACMLSGVVLSFLIVRLSGTIMENEGAKRAVLFRRVFPADQHSAGTDHVYSTELSEISEI